MPLPTASRTCWLSAALALALSSAAHAAEPAFDLAAVVVTATRQATRANEIIADVTVIDREAIEQAGPTTLPGLLAQANPACTWWRTAAWARAPASSCAAPAPATPCCWSTAFRSAR
jgi:hypothetical protein